jgi:ferritin-like metal-binding protein YciE
VVSAKPDPSVFNFELRIWARVIRECKLSESEQQAESAGTSYTSVSYDSEAEMRFHSAHIDNLRKLYLNQIEHLLSAENQIMEALPKIVVGATDPELKRVLQTHLQETREQISRLEQILQASTGKLEPKKSKPISALIDEGQDMIADAKNEPVRDAVIIAACQRIEHYEIAAYSSVCNFAEIIGETDQSGSLEKTLEEEKKAEAALTGMAEVANTRADRAA